MYYISGKINDKLEVKDTLDGSKELFSPSEVFKVVKSGVAVKGVEETEKGFKVKVISKDKIVADELARANFLKQDFLDIEGYDIYKSHLRRYISSEDEDEIVVPYGIKEISDGVFEYQYCKSIILPETLEKIGNSCFYGCQNLEKIIIPDSVDVIGFNCFCNCYRLEEVSLLGEIDILPNMVFQDCVSLRDIKLPSTLTKLRSSFFAGCRKLETISLPVTLECIDSYCFYNCTSLKRLELPNSITRLGENCFYNCTSLSIVVHSKKLQHALIKCNLISEDRIILV